MTAEVAFRYECAVHGGFPREFLDTVSCEVRTDGSLDIVSDYEWWVDWFVRFVRTHGGSLERMVELVVYEELPEMKWRRLIIVYDPRRRMYRVGAVMRSTVWGSVERIVWVAPHPVVRWGQVDNVVLRAHGVVKYDLRTGRYYGVALAYSQWIPEAVAPSVLKQVAERIVELAMETANAAAEELTWPRFAVYER